MLRTKIVCTLGPATSTPEVIEALVRGGMDVARINMSHGDREGHRALIRQVRVALKAVGRPGSILVDLQGPKIRVGILERPMVLEVGSMVTLAPEAHATAGEVPTTYASLAEELVPGDFVLLDDGLLELVCVSTDGLRATFEVLRGGKLTSKKGINLPGAKIRVPSVTEKDESDLEFALTEGVEFIGLSFVRQPSDVSGLRARVDGRALIVAKIEKASALDALDQILPETDLVMVARGDLGVELPFERVPLAQKLIVQSANYFARPVITATQMLESMIEHPRPTRAEASDVANAILDGTDALMLSGETAVGKYPLEALSALVTIAREVESSGALERGPRYIADASRRLRAGASPREHAVASATVESVRLLGAAAVIVITRSGFSARLVSSYRPPVPIIAVCTDDRTARQLTAVWGVRPVVAQGIKVSYDSLTDFGRSTVLESGVGQPGDAVVVSAGYPFHTSGTTNTMRVEML